MKNVFSKASLLSLLVIGATNTLRAQNWSFGPVVQLGLSKALTVDGQTQLNANRVTTTRDGDGIGSSLGAFARYDRPRWYVQLGLDRGKYSLANVSIYDQFSGFPMYPSAIRHTGHLSVGVKPLPWFRLNAGLVGARSNWKTYDYTDMISTYEAYVKRYPTDINSQRQLEQYRVMTAIQDSYKRSNVEGQLGIGADIGGLMLDLVYNRNLSPVLDGILFQGQTYPIRQAYSYWSMRIGYRLLPLKSHLLAPRKNLAYERIKRDIPFFWNAFHVAVGMLAEDIGSRLIYENRYTRYLTRRAGAMAGLTFSHSMADIGNNSSSFSATSQVSLLAGIRVLPLYSRRHTIGLTTGPMLTYQDDLQAGGGTGKLANGQTVRYLNLNNSSSIRQLSPGWHSSVDYQFALTDRLVAGTWLRVLGQSISSPDYANIGIQAGYRF